MSHFGVGGRFRRPYTLYMSGPVLQLARDSKPTTPWDAYNELLLGPDVERIRKLLVRYDLLRMVLDRPGDIVEAGVFKGAGLMYWLKLLEIYAPGSNRRVVGFDTFEYFADANPGAESRAVEEYVREAGFDGTSPEALRQRAKSAGMRADAADLVAGDIGITAPAYVRDHPGFRIALLHLDLDLGDATFAALEALWPRVVVGGIAVLDEYAVPRWTESDGVDRFLRMHRLELRSIPHARTPTAYILKAHR